MRLISKGFLLALLLSVTAACGSKSSSDGNNDEKTVNINQEELKVHDGSIYGEWASITTDGDFTFRLSLDIHPTHTKATQVCINGGKRAQVSLDVRSTVSGSTIEFLEFARDVVTKNGIACRIEVKPDSSQYQVNGGKITFTHRGKSSDFLLQRSNSRLVKSSPTPTPTPTNYDVLGSWLGDSQNNGKSFKMRLDINRDYTVFTSVCSRGSQSVSVTAQVKSAIVGNELRILSTEQKVETNGDLKCELNLRPMSLTYVVNGRTLSLSVGGETQQLTRIN